MKITAALLDWQAIDDQYSGKDLLIGNGASLAVCRDFSYHSLYDEASLDHEDQKVFEAAETENFEIVLDALRVGEIICESVGHRSEDIRQRYRSIRLALLNAVRKVHPRHSTIPDVTLRKIEKKALYNYKTIFSTNYDLLA